MNKELKVMARGQLKISMLDFQVDWIEQINNHNRIITGSFNKISLFSCLIIIVSKQLKEQKINSSSTYYNIINLARVIGSFTGTTGSSGGSPGPEQHWWRDSPWAGALVQWAECHLSWDYILGCHHNNHHHRHHLQLLCSCEMWYLVCDDKNE